jgi:flagellar motor switch protein FliN/FliY
MVDSNDLDEDLFGAGSKKKDIRSQGMGEDEEEIPHGEVDYLHDVPLSMQAQIGSVQKTMREVLILKAGSVIEFDKVVGEPMDVLIGGRLMCRGEIVVVNERYGIRISEVIRAEDSQKEMENL